MVNEQEKQTEETPAPTEDAGDKSETTSLIDRAHTAAERLEKAHIKDEELLRKREIIIAKEALGGISEAGQVDKKTPEQSAEEYSNEVLEGRINPLE